MALCVISAYLATTATHRFAKLIESLISDQSTLALEPNYWNWRKRSEDWVEDDKKVEDSPRLELTTYRVWSENETSMAIEDWYEFGFKIEYLMFQ